MIADNLVTFDRAIAAWNADQLDQYLKMYDDRILLHGYEGVGPGIDEVRRFYQHFCAAFPKSELVMDDRFAVDDKVVSRFHVNGTHRATFNGIPPTGKSFKLPGITILRFENARCVERWSSADFLGLLIQLGVVPAPK